MAMVGYEHTSLVVSLGRLPTTVALRYLLLCVGSGRKRYIYSANLYCVYAEISAPMSFNVITNT